MNRCKAQGVGTRVCRVEVII